MDLTIRCNDVNISSVGRNYGKGLTVALDSIDEDDLNVKEVAELISVDTFFEAKDADEIKKYIEDNYDWFDETK